MGRQGHLVAADIDMLLERVLLGAAEARLVLVRLMVDELVVELKTYDAGTDDGVSFTSGNADTSPKENITLLTSAASDTDFSNGVHRSSGQHIGTFTFKRQ